MNLLAAEQEASAGVSEVKIKSVKPRVAVSATTYRSYIIQLARLCDKSRLR